jgi:opacity protein-like surface antigen
MIVSSANLVVGVEGNINATNARGARPCLSPLDALTTCEFSANWIGTATARVGYAFWNRSLLYVRGGAAFGDGRIVANCNTGAASIFAPIGTCGTNDSQSRAGWTLGFGSEFALTPNWTARAETNYFDFGTSRFTLAGPTAVDVWERGFISTVGVNYRFNAGPVIAKY